MIHDESKLSSTTRAALDALERCTLTELGASVQWTPELEAEARRQGMSAPFDAARAELAADALDTIATGPRADVHPGVIDGLMALDDCDCDECIESTPLEDVSENAGLYRAGNGGAIPPARFPKGQTP